jgi:hypothetical protein
MAIFINDLFNFFWFDAVSGYVIDVVIIPLRLQLPELHRHNLTQGNAGFEALTLLPNGRAHERARCTVPPPGGK